jgi:hypothetical protein
MGVGDPSLSLGMTAIWGGGMGQNEKSLKVISRYFTDQIWNLLLNKLVFISEN